MTKSSGFKPDWKNPRKLRKLADQMEIAIGASQSATIFDCFGTQDCEPFWEMERLVERNAAKLRSMADDLDRAAELEKIRRQRKKR